MPESNELLSVGAQLIGLPLAGPESYSQQQLAYLKRALGVDETVLMDTPTEVSNNLEIELSEVFTNFERIRIEGVRNPAAGYNTSTVMEYAVGSSTYNLRFVAFLPQGANNTDLIFDVADCMLTTNKLNVNKYFRKTISSSISTETYFPLTITKIVGINRIASN